MNEIGDKRFEEYHKMILKHQLQIDEACYKKQKVLTLTFFDSKVPAELTRYCQIIEREYDILYNELADIGRLVILTTP